MPPLSGFQQAMKTYPSLMGRDAVSIGKYFPEECVASLVRFQQAMKTCPSLMGRDAVAIGKYTLSGGMCCLPCQVPASHKDVCKSYGT